MELEKLNRINWQNIAGNLNQNGYACLKQIIPETLCDRFIADYENEELYRKTVIMERYRFGLGEYKYFKYPLSNNLEDVRKLFYEGLAPIANSWCKALRLPNTYPSDYTTFKSQCHENDQKLPAVLILKYGTGGHNTLHQDLYGDMFFPIQIVLFLNQPEKDYTGGEFVLTEQVPRAQSKAMVLKPDKGDILIFTTNFRPVKGQRGYYRASMRHGVSAVHTGERHTLGIIFHDAHK
jgi:hypothetical protein